MSLFNPVMRPVPIRSCQLKIFEHLHIFTLGVCLFMLINLPNLPCKRTIFFSFCKYRNTQRNFKIFLVGIICVKMKLPNCLTSRKKQGRAWGQFHKLFCTLCKSFVHYAELLCQLKLLKSWAKCTNCLGQGANQFMKLTKICIAMAPNNPKLTQSSSDSQVKSSFFLEKKLFFGE